MEQRWKSTKMGRVKELPEMQAETPLLGWLFLTVDKDCREASRDGSGGTDGKSQMNDRIPSFRGTCCFASSTTRNPFDAGFKMRKKCRQKYGARGKSKLHRRGAPKMETGGNIN